MIKKSDLKLVSKDEENTSTTYTTFTLKWKDSREINVVLTQTFDSEVGEEGDEWEINSEELDRDFTEEEEEIIKDFCESKIQ